MTATIHADRRHHPDAGGHVRLEGGTRAAVEAVSPRVADHVPDRLVAEHPDAAAVVVASRRPVSVRVVSRGEEHRSPARMILGLVACASLALFAAGSSDPRRPVDRLGTTPPVPVATESAGAVAPAGCAPGVSVAVRCEPPCQPLSPLTLTPTCPPSGSRIVDFR